MSVNPIPRVQTAPAQVQKQIQLPFSKAWEISLKSIKIRLARSLITAGGIFLGIAFYSSVRTAGLFPPSGDPNDPAILAAAHRQQWLAVMALVVSWGVTRLIGAFGLYRFFAYRAIVDLSIFILVLAGLGLLLPNLGIRP